MKRARRYFQSVAVVVLVVLYAMASTYAQESGTVAVANHDWKSQTELGLKFVFSPKMAASAKVFSVYGYSDVADIIWTSDPDHIPPFDLVVSEPDRSSGVIVEDVNIRQLFGTRRNFEEFTDQQPDVLVRFALPYKLENLGVEPDQMVIHWADTTTESIGVGEDTEGVAQQLAREAHTN